jgi:hypothetical protein
MTKPITEDKCHQNEHHHLRNIIRQMLEKYEEKDLTPSKISQKKVGDEISWKEKMTKISINMQHQL